MNKKTLQITQGAAMIAVFIVMLLINRQTGNMFQEVFMFLYPIPMVAFSVQYGWKSSLPVLFVMAFFSFLFGSFYTIFYAVSEGIIGLVIGGCIHAKVDMTKTMISAMGLSALANVLDTIVLSSLFGMDLKMQITELQTTMSQMMEKTGMVVPDSMMSGSFLLQMMVISMVLLGVVQGFVVYQLSLLILRRLRFQIPKPRPFYEIVPPKWIGYAAFLMFEVYNYTFMKPLDNDLIQNAISALGICGQLFLVIYGMMGIMFYIRLRNPKLRGFGVLICIVGYFILAPIFMFIGLLYIITDWHKKMLELIKAS